MPQAGAVSKVSPIHADRMPPLSRSEAVKAGQPVLDRHSRGGGDPVASDFERSTPLDDWTFAY
jgi:hypothetical protein